MKDRKKPGNPAGRILAVAKGGFTIGLPRQPMECHAYILLPNDKVHGAEGGGIE